MLNQSAVESGIKLDDQLMKDYPQDVDALILRGQILNAQGQSDQAHCSHSSAEKEDPQKPGGALQPGNYARRDGQYGAGHKWCKSHSLARIWPASIRP